MKLSQNTDFINACNKHTITRFMLIDLYAYEEQLEKIKSKTERNDVLYEVESLLTDILDELKVLDSDYYQKHFAAARDSESYNFDFDFESINL